MSIWGKKPDPYLATLMAIEIDQLTVIGLLRQQLAVLQKIESSLAGGNKPAVKLQFKFGIPTNQK